MLRQQDRDRILNLTKQGKNRQQIADEMQLSVATVRNVLRPLGLLCEKRVTGAKRGSFNKRENGNGRHDATDCTSSR